MNRVIFVLLFLLSPITHARVFDLNQERFASFLVIGASTSTMGTSAFDRESSAASYSENVSQLYSGELGFLLSFPTIAYRFGFEIVQPPSLAVVKAKDSSGTVLYSNASTIRSFVPKLGIEVTLNYTPESRTILTGFYGNATLTFKNTYTNSSLAPTGDHDIEAAGAAILSGISLAYEKYFTDRNTFIFEMGYRKLLYNKLIYSNTDTTFNGVATNGNVVLDSSGNTRQIDFTGYFANIGIRFYIF